MQVAWLDVPPQSLVSASLLLPVIASPLQEYLQDLAELPENPWALKGLAQVYAAQGPTSAEKLQQVGRADVVQHRPVSNLTVAWDQVCAQLHNCSALLQSVPVMAMDMVTMLSAAWAHTKGAGSCVCCADTQTGEDHTLQLAAMSSLICACALTPFAG